MTRHRDRTSAIAWLYAATFTLPALCALSMPAEAGPVDLIQNGNFSLTSLASPGGYLCSNSGGTVCTSNLTDWSATCATGGCTGGSTPASILFAGTNGSAWNGGIGLYWNNIGDAPLGGNEVGIDGDPQFSSVLSQSVSGLTSGQSYTLQFYQASAQQRGLTGATTEQWQVSLGGGTSQKSALQNTASQSADPWEKVTMTFVANASSEILQFVALGTPSGEPPVVLLGDVSLEANAAVVPEPATLALIGAGLLGLVMLRRRQVG